MKRFDFRVLITSVLMLAIACSVGASNALALTIDGESILSGLISAGTSLGIDISDYFSTTESSTLPSYSGNAKDDLVSFLSQIGFDFSESKIIDLTDYVINRKGSFEDWVYDNYGDDVKIPDSVKSLSTTELVMLLMGNMLYPQETAASTSKYVFTTKNNPSTQVPSTDGNPSTQLKTEITNQQQPDYVTGDADGDGKVTAKDARLALRVSAGLGKLSGSALEAADVNGDGRITAKDARSILRYSAKLSSGF